MLYEITILMPDEPTKREMVVLDFAGFSLLPSFSSSRTRASCNGV